MDEVDVYDENENEMDELEQLKEQESLLKRVHGGQDWGRPEWVNKLVGTLSLLNWVTAALDTRAAPRSDCAVVARREK